MIIYKVTNLINNKIYIGKTIRTLHKRKIDHFKHPHSSYFHNALKKYKNNFKWEIIDTAKTQEELSEKEKYYIKKFNSNNHNKGYNLTDGGEGIINLPKKTLKIMSLKQTGRLNSNYKNGKYAGKHFCNKCHKKISNNNVTLCKSCCKIGIKFTKQHRKNMALSKLGDKNPAKRKEVRKKISETVKKRWQDRKNNTLKCEDCYYPHEYKNYDEIIATLKETYEPKELTEEKRTEQCNKDNKSSEKEEIR